MSGAERWLLNTFTTAELGLIVVGGAVLLSALGFVAVRRFAPAESRIDNNEVAGVLLGLLGAFYGVVLGFVIVVLFEDFRAADQSVKDETTALAQLYRATDLFPAAEHTAIGRQIARYAIAVRTQEWQDMRDGHESQRAHDLLGAVYGQLEHVTPQTADQRVFYQQAVETLAQLVSARRTRLNAAVDELPGVFQVLLIGGGVVLILFLYFFGMRNARAHLAMVTGVAGVLAFSLLLALVLAFPFSGDIAVSNAPFRLGVIGQLSPQTGLATGGPCDNCVGGP